MDPANHTIIGLDIGGTKTAVVEGSAQAEILQREEIATEASIAISLIDVDLRAQGVIDKPRASSLATTNLPLTVVAHRSPSTVA
jgi:hypothetical protein